MKIRLYIDGCNIEDDENYFYIHGNEDGTCDIYLQTNGIVNVLDVINDKNNILKAIKLIRENDKHCNCEFDKLKECDKKALDFLDKNPDKICDNLEQVIFRDYNTNPYKFLLVNRDLPMYNLVFDRVIEINDFDLISKIKDKFSVYFKKIQFRFEGDAESISLFECYDTMVKLKNYADEIKRLDLSQFEAIMYVYDLVKERIYKKENEGEYGGLSRDLHKTLFGDKIVCLGYVNIFSAILKHLYIDSKKLYLFEDGKERGHARCLIHVKDDKYNVDGAYLFDPTWDRKDNEDDIVYLCKYKYFAKTWGYFDNVGTHNYKDGFLRNYSDDIYDRFVKDYETKGIHALNKYLTTLNHMSYILSGKPVIDVQKMIKLDIGGKESKKTLDDIKKVCDMFKKEIPAETMITLFNNVRKIQFYNDPGKYPYTINAVFAAFKISDWQFEKTHMEPEFKLMTVLYDLDKERQPAASRFKGFIQENDLNREISGVHLAKTVQQVVRKKTNNQK